jgi:hypothetical protein
MHRNLTPRFFNLALGTWLLISAFLWTHSGAQFTNTWVVGLGAMLTAAAAMRVEWARFLTVGLAIWLFIGSWALPGRSEITFWHNQVVAILMFVAAWIPSATPERMVPHA